MPTAAPPVAKQISKACALLRLPGQDAAAQERAVVDALRIMDFQMDRFADDRQLEARSLKAEKKWMSDLLKAGAARPPWLDAPELDKHILTAYVRGLERTPSYFKRLQFSAYRKGLAASTAYGLLHKYGFKLTGNRQGKFVRLAGILYDGNSEATCYGQCCELLQKKKAAR